MFGSCLFLCVCYFSYLQVCQAVRAHYFMYEAFVTLPVRIKGWRTYFLAVQIEEPKWVDCMLSFLASWPYIVHDISDNFYHHLFSEIMSGYCYTVHVDGIVKARFFTFRPSIPITVHIGVWLSVFLTKIIIGSLVRKFCLPAIFDSLISEHCLLM